MIVGKTGGAGLAHKQQVAAHKPVSSTTQLLATSSSSPSNLHMQNRQQLIQHQQANQINQMQPNQDFSMMTTSSSRDNNNDEENIVIDMTDEDEDMEEPQVMQLTGGKQPTTSELIYNSSRLINQNPSNSSSNNNNNNIEGYAASRGNKCLSPLADSSQIDLSSMAFAASEIQVDGDDPRMFCQEEEENCNFEQLPNSRADTNTNIQGANTTTTTTTTNATTNANSAQILSQFQVGDLVWFDPNLFGYSIPGKIIDIYQDLNVLTIEGYQQVAPSDEVNSEPQNRLLLLSDETLQLYDLSSISQFKTIKLRKPLISEQGHEDLIQLDELTNESILWNLKLRFKQELVYTNCGQKILISVNPFKQLSEMYNLDQVNKYDSINSSKLAITLPHDNNNKQNHHYSHSSEHQAPRTNSMDNDNRLISRSFLRWLLINDNHSSESHKSKKKICPSRKSPHIFAMANEALKRLLISGQDQCFVLLGESGSGKTEACKLLIQYLATVNKSPSNLMTEQILESIAVLDSFGNAKTIHNDNSSRYGKLLNVCFNLTDGFITNAKITDLNLLDRTRIVSQSESERNYHIFYELLNGLSKLDREKYGLQSAENYFYLNQGHCVELESKEDGDDFRSLMSSMQVLGFNNEEQDTIFRLLASVLHLGNIYFHRKILAIRSGKLATNAAGSSVNQRSTTGHQNNSNNQFINEPGQPVATGVEGVEIGSDTEVRWVSHLLQIQFEQVKRCLTVRTTEATYSATGGGISGPNNNQQPPVMVDRIITPLNIDQALDTRDAIARALYTCLFKWLVQRVNAMINSTNSKSAASSFSASSGFSSHQQVSNYSTLMNHNPQLSNQQEPIYLCRTSESLCEFQPDKLTETSRQSSLSRHHLHQKLSKRFNSSSIASNANEKQLREATISILDAFGFENLQENNFEQLCINYAAELLQYHTSRYLIRLEQVEYFKERLRWEPIQSTCLSDSNRSCQNNGSGSEKSRNGTNTSNGSPVSSIVNLISKKPLGILALLDDECNFPKATDQSFAEKCHHNHTLNENYQCARLEANCQEFGVRHFKQSNRLVWYQVDGFIEKNRDALRPDILELLLGSKMNIVADMLRKFHKSETQSSNSKTLSRTYDGRYVSMKPRTATVAAKFQDILHNNMVLDSISCSSPSGSVTASTITKSHLATSGGQLPNEFSHYAENHRITTNDLQADNQANPWFIICLRASKSKVSNVFDVHHVQSQMKCMNLLELAQIRKFGYPIRLRYGEFVRRYKCLVPHKFLNNLSSCQSIKAANYKRSCQYTQEDERTIMSNKDEIKRAIRDVCSSIIEFGLLNGSSSSSITTTNNANQKPAIGRVEFTSTDNIKDFYQCGLNKMFLNEQLYEKLEYLRLAAHKRAIELLQRTIRMWPVRKEFLLKRKAAILIQAQVRGHLARQEFWRQYVLIVTLQRHWRYQIQVKRERALESRRRAQRQQQLRQLQELQAQQRKQANAFRHRQQPPVVAGKSTHATSGPQLNLDIPEELAQLYRIQRLWRPVHDFSHLNELNLSELLEKERRRAEKHGGKLMSVPFVVSPSSRDKSKQDEDSQLQASLAKSVKSVERLLFSSEIYPQQVPIDREKCIKISQEIELDEKYSLQNFILKYYPIEAPQFGYSRLPITRPFTWPKIQRREKLAMKKVQSPEQEAQVLHRFQFVETKAISIYKLILRYIDSDIINSLQKSQHQNEQQQQPGGDIKRVLKFKLIADYIIYLCIKEPLLRDEIYLQLASQSWQNPKAKSQENVWQLILNCLCCFAPVELELGKFLLKFAQNFCSDKYKQPVVDKLAQSIGQTSDLNLVDSSRQYPISLLEYWANRQAIDELALPISCYMDDHALNGSPSIFNENSNNDHDNNENNLEEVSLINYSNKTLAPLTSQTSAQILAAKLLRARNVPDANLAGWSVEIQHQGVQSEFSCRFRGDDRLLDHFSRLEMLPDFEQLIDEAVASSGEAIELTLAQKQQQQEDYQASGNNNDNNNLLDQGWRTNSMLGARRRSAAEFSASSHRNSMASQRSADYYQQQPGYLNPSQMMSSDLDLRSSHRRTPSILNRHQHLGYSYEQQRQLYPEVDLAVDQEQYQQDSGYYRRSNRRSMSMQELNLATSALNGRYLNHHQGHEQQVDVGGYLPHDTTLGHVVPVGPGSQHYASSYVSSSSNHTQPLQQQRSNRHKQQGSLQQLAAKQSSVSPAYSSYSPNGSGSGGGGGGGSGHRRSHTPDGSLSAHRMSSSAYGSESLRSSSYATGASYYGGGDDDRSNSRGRVRDRNHGSLQRNQRQQQQQHRRQLDGQQHPQQLYGYPLQQQQQQQQKHLLSTQTSGIRQKPRRSASSSSRSSRPHHLIGKQHLVGDYGHSDYEQYGIGHQFSREQVINQHQQQRVSATAAAPVSLGQGPVGRSPNQLVGRYKPTPLKKVAGKQPAPVDQVDGPMNFNAEGNIMQDSMPGQHRQQYQGSSAMSDTSEAPSLASHVRGVNLPQHNGDLDRYLDDLFNPLLNGADLDDISDIRSLASSIKGTTTTPPPPTTGDQAKEQNGEGRGGESRPETSQQLQQQIERATTVISPTFESLIKNLVGSSSSIDAAGEPTLATPTLDLVSMNLKELKALNEQLELQIQAAQQSNRSSIELAEKDLQIEAPVPVPVPPPQPSFDQRPGATGGNSNRESQSPSTMDDLYSRARTVRIGKWRWPPALEDMTKGVEGASGEAEENQEQHDGKEGRLPTESEVEARLARYFESQKKRSSVISSSSRAEPAVEAAKASVAPPEVESAATAAAATAATNVGRLKISSEMKAKLEQLTGVTKNETSNSPISNSSSESGSSNLVSKVKSKLLANSSLGDDQGSKPVRKLANLRKNLLENQLLGSQQQQQSIGDSDNSACQSPSNLQIDDGKANKRLSSASLASSVGGGKILAAKQQLAAAAGVALDGVASLAGDSEAQGQVSQSQASSRINSSKLASPSSSPHPNLDQSNSSNNKISNNVAPNEEMRKLRLINDELGPQSQAAISQRQAFYQTSAHDGADSQPPIDGDSSCGKNLPIICPIPAPVTVKEIPGAESTVSYQGQNGAQDGIVSPTTEPTTASSVAKSLVQRQHENLIGNKNNKSGGGNDNLKRTSQQQQQQVGSADQWVSSPDPTLERLRKRKRVSSVAGLLSRRSSQQLYQQQVVAAVGGQSKQPMVSQEKALTCLTYANVDWQVRVRKEFFLPSETYDDPLVIQLIFAQLVADVFNPRQWTRLNVKERAAMKSLMKDNSIGYSPSLPQIGQMQSVKRDLIRMARSFGLYFTRSYLGQNFALISSAVLFDLKSNGKQNKRNSGSLGGNGTNGDSDGELFNSSGDELGGRNQTNQLEVEPKNEAERLARRLASADQLGLDWIDMIGVHHSGLRLVSFTDATGNQLQQQVAQVLTANNSVRSSIASGYPANDEPIGYKVVETLKYRDMADVSQVGARELLVSGRNGKRCWLISSDQASQLGALLRCFHADYNDHLRSSTQKTGAPQGKTLQQNQQQQKSKSNLSNKQRQSNRLGQQKEQQQQDALLATDDGDDGHRVKQRQVSNSFSNLDQASDPNDDLANSERVLHNHLATNSASHYTKQSNDGVSGSSISGISHQLHSGIRGDTSGGGRDSGRGDERPDGGLATDGQGGGVSGNHGGSNTDPSDKLDSDSEIASGNLKKEQVEQGNCLTTKEDKQSKSGGNKLWQNSMSKMSAKFNIFGTGTSGMSAKRSAKKQQQQQVANGQQQDSEPITLDGWIETKVDFEDEDQQDDRSNIKLTGHTNSNQTSNQEQAAARESIYSSSSTSNASSPRQGDKVDRGGDSYSSAQQSPAAAAEATKLDSNRVIGPQQPVDQQQQQQQNKQEDGKYSMLQFALYNFREAIEKYSLESKVQKVSPQVAGDTSTLRGSLKLIESLRNGTGSSIDQQPGDTNTNTSKSSKSNRKSSNASLLSAQQTSQLASTSGDWTWRELAEMVKFTRVPLKHSLLRLPSDDLNKRAIECFHAIMQYMGDNCLQQTSGGLGSKSSVPPPQNDVDCVYLILMNCHNFPHLRDEVYCQLIKQTTNNRSDNGDSCLKGWRLFSIVAAYFDCSDSFKPYLLKYLETAAYDKRRAYCSVALLCLQNLRKTFKFGGRKNVPSIEEIAATSAGRNSKRQIYRLPGGTERVINTKSTTVVDDIIYEICSNMLDVTNQDEMLEFSLYCIADGDLYTMPLNRDEYILDVTTELIKNHQQYFLIFCRSIWYYPLRLDSKLYIEVIFNQIAPDYLEGLFLVLPNLRTRRNGQLSPLKLKSRQVKEIARIAALLHRASGTDYLPQKDEIKYLLPRTIVSAMRQQQRIAQQQQQTGTNSGHSPRSPGQTSSDMFDSYEFGDSYESSSNSNQQQQPLAEEEPGETNGPLDSIVMAPQKWIELVQNNWRDMTAFDTLDAKAQFLNIIRHWPLFGSSFFAIKLFQRDLIQPTDFILALNKFGIQMLDILTHETKHKYPFNEIISTRKVRSEDGALYLDLKCGNLMKRTIIRIQTDQAHEISRLIRHYIDIELLNSNSDRTLQLHNQQQ